MEEYEMTQNIQDVYEAEKMQYPHLLEAIRTGFEQNTGTLPVFRTDAQNLYDLFVENLPEELHQIHNCSNCRRFVNKYGGLVTLDENGKRMPVMWAMEMPQLYTRSIKAIEARIRKAKITGVFYTAEEMLGRAETGQWHHMAVSVPEKMRYVSKLYCASQAEAAKNEEWKMLRNTVETYPKEDILRAIAMLKGGTLTREEKFLDNAEWLLDALERVRTAKHKDEVLWYLAATAKTGYCHFNNNMLGTLLEDIHAGYSQAVITRRFLDKMHPLKYQRPTELPKKQNIERAEEIIARLGLADSLKRRFARLDEIDTIWKPVRTERTGGIFKDVPYREQKSAADTAPVHDVVMTWEKFARTMLKDAVKIEYHVSEKRESYGALVTASVQEAPPILQWDTMEHRNPFCWYVYHGGSLPSVWNLKPNSFTEVEAITLKPCNWQPGFEYQGIGVCLVLKDCYDVRVPNGLALFPETLKKELHEVRSTIEAYSNRNKIEMVDGPNACGLITGNKAIDIILRVTTSYGVTDVYIDRWD